MSRVLVIDDETIVGTILTYALDAAGHETLVANGGKAGLETALAQAPDVIVLDLMMPDVNGYDVLEILRHDAATMQVPILVLTAVALAREKARCLAEGADIVMTKPFDPLNVTQVIEALLGAEVSTH